MTTTPTAAEAAAAYSCPAKFFHWSLALLLPIQIGIGWYMVSIEDKPGSVWYFALHISLGLTAALLIALRFTWRLNHAPPALPVTVPPWQAKAAWASHALLYASMLSMPVTGYLGAAFSGEAISYFGIPLPGWATKNDGIKELFYTAHSVIAWLLVALVAAHVLAALKHLLLDKDTVFWRMWPR